ncbi:MAG: formate dehydrogenase accessory protein FdhE [Neisseria sp.]|nr:formate dehydrogenase accessory protein FdhE [Neisseria sp.]
MEKPFFTPDFCLLPPHDVFARRSERFTELAADVTTEWAEYLRLLAAVCAAQQTVLEAKPFRLPESIDTLEPADDVAPVLTALLDALSPIHHPAVQDTVQRLRLLPAEEIHALACRVLQQQTQPQEQAFVPWLQAALQIICTAWAMQSDAEQHHKRDPADACPCCGSEAFASMVYNGGERDGLRYMCCPLCNTQWNMLRAQCTFCGSNDGISIQSAQNAQQPALLAAAGETCENCHGYRKMYLQEKARHADPFADDLATLALDILLSQSGYARGGANPFLLQTE